MSSEEPMSPQLEALEAALPVSEPRASAAPPRWLPVRTLDASHRAQVREHLLALAVRDRILRFGHAASDEQITRYTKQIDFVHDEVFGVFDRKLCLVALAHLAFSRDGLSAEFGVSVLDQVRGRGFGRRLFEHTVMHARNRGVSTLIIYIASDNKAMLGIARRAGAELSFQGDQAQARLPLTAQSLGSQMGALLESRAAEFDYQLKLQVQRLDRLWPAVDNYSHPQSVGMPTTTGCSPRVQGLISPGGA